MTVPIMRRRFERLVHTGNVLVDIVLTVRELPQRGGDVIATSTTALTGGGFNVMAAAARLGLLSAYAGAHGTGPRADQVRTDLAAEGIAVLTDPTPDLDTGFDICLVEDTGERTFVTSSGAEAALRIEQLAAITITDRDAVYVSGYSLAHPTNTVALDSWIASLPHTTTVVFDPGPLVSSLPVGPLTRLLQRADWLTCNATEAATLAVTDQLDAAVQALREQAPRASVVVRAGRGGAVLAEPGRPAVRVPSVPVRAIDTTGAGDAHTAALLASLAAGGSPADAVATANAAAAFAVTRRGPATGPTTGELAEFRSRHPASR